MGNYSDLGIAIDLSVDEALLHLKNNLSAYKWVDIRTGGTLVSSMYLYMPTVTLNRHHIMLVGMHTPDTDGRTALVDFWTKDIEGVRVWNSDDLIWTYHFTWPEDMVGRVLNGIVFTLTGAR